MHATAPLLWMGVCTVTQRLELAWSRRYGEDAGTAAGTEGAPGLWMLSIDRILVAPDVDQVRGAGVQERNKNCTVTL